MFNEEPILVQNTLKLCRFLDGIGSYEILIGSNGSTDKTADLARQLASENPRIRFFEIPERKVGLIFQTFLRHARSDFLISLDMDLSTRLEFVPQTLALLQENDLVIGSKKIGSQKRSFVRRVGSDLYIRCAQRLLRLDAEDYSMGSKGYRVSFFRRFLEEIGEGTTYVVNCVYFARRFGARVVEIPVVCEDFRRSKFSLTKEAFDKYSHLVGLWWRDVRGQEAESRSQELTGPRVAVIQND